MLIMMLTMVITAPMMAIGGVILALSQDAQLAWVLIAVMPVMALIFGLIMRTAIAVNRLIAFLLPALIVMLNLTSIAIIWFGGHRIDQGTMQVGAMIASLQYAMQILFAVFMVTAMFVMLPRASASAARINEVLDLVPEIVDPPAPVQPQLATRRGHV